MDQYYLYQNCLFIQQPMARSIMDNGGNTFTGIEADDNVVDSNKDGTMYTVTYCPSSGSITSCPSNS